MGKHGNNLMSMIEIKPMRVQCILINFAHLLSMVGGCTKWIFIVKVMGMHGDATLFVVLVVKHFFAKDRIFN